MLLFADRCDHARGDDESEGATRPMAMIIKTEPFTSGKARMKLGIHFGPLTLLRFCRDFLS